MILTILILGEFIALAAVCGRWATTKRERDNAQQLAREFLEEKNVLQTRIDLLEDRLKRVDDFYADPLLDCYRGRRNASASRT